MKNSLSWKATILVVGITLAAFLPVSDLFAGKAKTISEIDVQEQNGATRIILRGAEDPMYTAFMREDPPRLIIELPDVMFDGIETPIHIGNDLVESVTLSTFGDPRVSPSMARISVSLKGVAEYELLPEGDELAVVLMMNGASSEVATAPEAMTEEVPASADVSIVEEEVAAEASMPPEEAMVEDAVVEETVTEEAEPEVAAEVEAAPVEEPVTEAIAVDEEALVETPVEPEALQAPDPEPVEKTPTSQIVNITTEGNNVVIAADGPIDNVDSFELENPARVVIDFWGARSVAKPAKFNVEEGVVEQVRVGAHADKVRVVLDLRGPITAYRLEPADQGVKIILDSAELTADEPEVTENESVPAAPAEFVDDDNMLPDEAEFESTEPLVEVAQVELDTESAELAQPTEFEATVENVAEASEDLGPAQVRSVHFESLPGMDRVVIELDHAAKAQLVEPDAATAIVEIFNTSIAEETERRVDTKEFGGPVEMFSVFQTPDVTDDRVRVVLKRSPGMKPQLSWDGDRVQIEFMREVSQAEPSVEPALGEALEPGSPEPLAPMAPTTDSAADTLPGSTSTAMTPLTGVPASIPNAIDESDPFYNGPADPASVDILQEGGFNEEKAYGGRRISLDFKDADIGNILRLIAEVSDLNIIAGEEVEGQVTIRLVDVPWDQAMDVILLTKGLGFERVGSVLRIAPIETLKLEREARLQDRRAREKLEDLVVKLQPVNYASVTEIKELVSRLLSSRGTVNVDERTNTVIIKDIPSVIQEATALVKAIDTQTPQVLIEAKIVEASLNFSRSLGLVWGVGYNPTTSDTGNVRTAGGEDLQLGDGTLDSVLTGSPQASNFTSSNPVAGVLNGIMNLGFLAFDQNVLLDLQLQAAETNNKGKVISSPRVVTLDNREAIIKQGVAVKFTEITRDTVTTSFVDAVLELKVTPHITADRSIIMKIKVSRNAPQLSTASGDVVGISKNEAETEALVRDGETMVLGGIFVVDSGTQKSKLPFLADIPILGTVFRNSTMADERRELLMFVTPRIVQGPSSDL